MFTFLTSVNFMIGYLRERLNLFYARHFGATGLSFQRLQILAAEHGNVKYQLNGNEGNLCFRVFLAMHIMQS